MVQYEFFGDLTLAPKDEMNDLKIKLENCQSSKVDVSAGVYRGENGESYTLSSVKAAKGVLHANDPGHDYNFTLGIKNFNLMAADIIFGKDISTGGYIATCQTISGTGACSIAIKFLVDCCKLTNFYIGTPTWPNYAPMIEAANAEVVEYVHYNPLTRSLDFESVLEAISKAKMHSVFILQLCCHNPTGTDFSIDQWKILADKMQEKKIMPVFDSAYQGFGSGDIAVDAKPIRLYYAKGLQFLVCQSFSKNLGLYSERVGALHVVVCEKKLAEIVSDQLRSIFRRECSSAPAYGARLAVIIANDPKLTEQWRNDLRTIYKRLVDKRIELHDLLIKYQTPGSFDHLLNQNGLFWFSGLSKVQCKLLVEEYHIFIPSNGRVNIAGLNNSNIHYFAKSFSEVIKISV